MFKDKYGFEYSINLLNLEKNKEEQKKKGKEEKITLKYLEGTIEDLDEIIQNTENKQDKKEKQNNNKVCKEELEQTYSYREINERKRKAKNNIYVNKIDELKKQTNLKEKKTYKIINIKKDHKLLKEREKIKDLKMINIFINRLNKKCINIIKKKETIYIYGQSAYIALYFLKTIKTYKRAKILRKKRKTHTEIYIIIPKMCMRDFLEYLKIENVSYYIYLSHLGYLIEDKNIYENNNYGKVLKISKKYAKKENKIYNIIQKLFGIEDKNFIEVVRNWITENIKLKN